MLYSLEIPFDYFPGPFTLFGNLGLMKANPKQVISHAPNFFLKFIYYLFLAALGLCCTRAFSSCGEWGLLFVAMHRLLILVASLVAEQGSRCTGFSSCSTRAQ